MTNHALKGNYLQKSLRLPQLLISLKIKGKITTHAFQKTSRLCSIATGNFHSPKRPPIVSDITIHMDRKATAKK
jgi:hypothetical protein